jgi:hypothetical protein
LLRELPQPGLDRTLDARWELLQRAEGLEFVHGEAGAHHLDHVERIATRLAVDTGGQLWRQVVRSDLLCQIEGVLLVQPL